MNTLLKSEGAEDIRAVERQGFIDRLNAFAGASIVPLRIDASIRRFFRVAKPSGETAVLMDARPPMENTAVFEYMREKFARIGLTVPEIYACDHGQGLVLMEDFGDERYYERITSGKDDIRTLYALAVDGLIWKAKADPAVALEQSVDYSDEYWLFRVEQFLQHYMPRVLNRVPTQGEREGFLEAFHRAIQGAHRFAPVLLHGDYGAQNLYFLPKRQGLAALGLIDFQDLTDARGNMMGSPAFDLVFLLQDVRLSLPENLEHEMRARFVQGVGLSDVQAFEGEYAVIGTAQAVKCLGLFARLGHVDGRAEYLQFLPHCWRNIVRNFTHPDLKEVKEWFTQMKIEL